MKYKAKLKPEVEGATFMNLLTHPGFMVLLFLGVWGLLSYLMIANSRHKGWRAAVCWIAFWFAATALAFLAGILRTYARLH